MSWDDIQFAQTEWFYLLFLLVLPLLWYIYKFRAQFPGLQISTLKFWPKAGTPYKVYFMHFAFVLRLLVLTFLLVALARPQTSFSTRTSYTEGIDIVLSLDVSSSMLAQDFKPDRLEAAKEVATKFVSGRENDRMGLVVFSGESFTLCPLTLDRAVLMNQIQTIQSGIIEDGTAIGLGLANAINRLKDSKAKSRIIILMTDGVNNKGEIDPVTAADLAQTLGIRVYTIGIGTRGLAPYPVETMFGTEYQQMEVEIDEAILSDVATRTGGKYFRATNNMELKTVYDEIDTLEKSKIEVEESNQKEELFLWPLLTALAIYLFELLMRYTLLKTIA